jgi:hypothetical protein
MLNGGIDMLQEITLLSLPEKTIRMKQTLKILLPFQYRLSSIYFREQGVRFEYGKAEKNFLRNLTSQL